MFGYKHRDAMTDFFNDLKQFVTIKNDKTAAVGDQMKLDIAKLLTDPTPTPTIENLSTESPQVKNTLGYPLESPPKKPVNLLGEPIEIMEILKPTQGTTSQEFINNKSNSIVSKQAPIRASDLHNRVESLLLDTDKIGDPVAREAYKKSIATAKTLINKQTEDYPSLSQIEKALKNIDLDIQKLLDVKPLVNIITHDSTVNKTIDSGLPKQELVDIPKKISKVNLLGEAVQSVGNLLKESADLDIGSIIIPSEDKQVKHKVDITSEVDKGSIMIPPKNKPVKHKVDITSQVEMPSEIHKHGIIAETSIPVNKKRTLSDLKSIDGTKYMIDETGAIYNTIKGELTQLKKRPPGITKKFIDSLLVRYGNDFSKK